MSRNYFTDEQIRELENNPYVKGVSKANVSFTEEFKQKFYGLLLDGVGPTKALLQLNVNHKTLGRERINQLSMRIKMQAKRVEGFSRKKSDKVGRPKKLTFCSPEEEIKYLKDQLEYKNQEIEFLKKLEALDMKYQKYQRKKD